MTHRPAPACDLRTARSARAPSAETETSGCAPCRRSIWANPRAVASSRTEKTGTGPGTGPN